MWDVVWFKRDLRLRDHAPLAEALRCGRQVLLLHLFEPLDLAHPTTSNRHVRFRWQAWSQIAAEVDALGWPVQVVALEADAVEAFQWLHEAAGIRTIWSHEETGLRHTFDRDRALADWAKAAGVAWRESEQQAVVRGLKGRGDWADRWHRVMHAPPVQPVPGPQLERARIAWPAAWPVRGVPQVKHGLDPGLVGPFQPGGEREAHRYLATFFAERIHGYRRQIGQPAASRRSCSRLSPYLAWGCLSMRQAYQAYRAAPTKGVNSDLRAFGSRLRWQGHFIQKFESEDRMEFEPVNRGYTALEHRGLPETLAAWKEGRTGIPMIDACMRCVVATGYLNFRMRAMLVSFLCHHLDHPWDAGVEHLARCFLDFEPGIHYAQFQMQAGVTGINTLRIYNPVKQGLERDADGAFIRQWIPELAHVQAPEIHHPWTIPPMQRLWAGGTGDYPDPIVDVEAAARAAREKLWGFKRDPGVRQEAHRILSVHVAPQPVKKGRR